MPQETFKTYEEKMMKAMEPFFIVRNKLTARRMTASDVKKILGLTYRQLSDWAKKQIRLKTIKAQSGWRRFSIEDLIQFRIIQELQKLNIMLENLLIWVRTMNLIESILIEFSNGKQIALYTNLSSFKEVYIQGRDQKMLNKILTSRQPSIILPLNELIDEILTTVSKKIKSLRFSAKKDSTGVYVYTIDSNRMTVPGLPKFKP